MIFIFFFRRSTKSESESLIVPFFSLSFSLSLSFSREMFRKRVGDYYLGRTLGEVRGVESGEEARALDRE